MTFTVTAQQICCSGILTFCTRHTKNMYEIKVKEHTKKCGKKGKGKEKKDRGRL